MGRGAFNQLARNTALRLLKFPAPVYTCQPLPTMVVTVEPERIEVDGGVGLKIQAEADYGGEAFSVRGLL